MIDGWEDLASTQSTSDNDGYFQTDEFEDVIASLNLLDMVLERLSEEPQLWKWAILATHSALQGACVCILTGTDGLGALSERSPKELWEKLYGETPSGRKIDDCQIVWPEEHLAELPELLKRLPDKLAVTLPGRNAQKYGYDLAGDLRRLHVFRNQFTHLPSVGWSIELEGMPRILVRAIEQVRAIVQSENFRRYNKFHELGADTLIQRILFQLSN